MTGLGSYSWCYSIVVSYGLQGQGSFNYISGREGGRESEGDRQTRRRGERERRVGLGRLGEREREL